MPTGISGISWMVNRGTGVDACACPTDKARQFNWWVWSYSHVIGISRELCYIPYSLALPLTILYPPSLPLPSLLHQTTSIAELISEGVKEFFPDKPIVSPAE